MRSLTPRSSATRSSYLTSRRCGTRATNRRSAGSCSAWRRAAGRELDDAEQDRLEERIDRVRDLRDFRFQVIELGTGANEEQVADIFVRINSEGVQLNQADFILTLMSVHWEKGRRELEQFCRDGRRPESFRASPKNPFIDPAPTSCSGSASGLAFRRGRLQHVYSLLRGKDLETGQVSPQQREAQFERLREAQEHVLDLSNWHEFLKCLTGDRVPQPQDDHF